MEEKQQHGRWKYLMCIWFGIFCFPLIAIAAQGVIKVKGYFSEVQAIRQIEKNSNYVFFYDAADLDEVKRKNIDCQGTIEKVLSVVFEGSNVNYLVRGDEVVLKVNKQSVQQKGEKRVVTGVVTDAIDGEPLVGVNIVVKGQKSGTITDLNGRYSISVIFRLRIRILSGCFFKLPFCNTKLLFQPPNLISDTFHFQQEHVDIVCF